MSEHASTPASMQAPNETSTNQPKSTSVMAILGLVFSFFLPLLGLIFSIIGMGQTKNNKQGGRGLAIAGLILSIVFMLISTLWIILIIIAAATSDTTSSDIDFGSSSSSSLFEEEKTETEKVKVNESAVADGVEMVVTSVDTNYQTTDQFAKPASGNKLLLVNVSTVNVGDDSQYVSEFDFKVRTSNGEEITSSYISGLENELTDSSLAPNGTKKGSIVFEVPASDNGLVLVFDPNTFSGNSVEVTL